MTDGKPGLGAVVGDALLHPERFFEAVKAGRVSARPFWFYVVAVVMGAAGTGMSLANVANQPLLTMALACGFAQLLLSPLGWLVEVSVTHAIVRLFGGKGDGADTRAVVGFSSLPAVLGLLPYSGVPVLLWAMVIKVRGLRALHRIELGSAIFAALASAASVLILPIVLALSLRFLVLEAFKVPAGSMFPSVEIGDHVFVTKATYGAFEKSLPARGDVVVFEYPEPNPHAERYDYIKRVIALPGDVLEFDDSAPIINGWRVPTCKLGLATATLGNDSSPSDFEVVVEFLQGKAYLVAFEQSRSEGRQGPYRVKPGEFWVVGDNRNNSSDSRAWNQGRGGGVPVDNLKGRARWLWFPPERLGIDLAGKPVLPKAIEQLAPALERCLESVPDLAHTTPPPPK
ncbi:MAG TPA: signal peptidase I [Polyangiaceae bacterium]|nr:signal peptidase I [Polyangiaceae bacterium]